MESDTRTGDPMRDKYQALIERPDFEWHCVGRHGVIHMVTRAEEPEIVRTLIYFFGRKCVWATKFLGGYRQLEFVHMTKVFPPPRKPWEWCGTTVAFKDWQRNTEENKDAADAYKLGDMVSFVYKRERFIGFVSGFGRTGRITVIVPGSAAGKYYIPARMLVKQ